MKVESGKNNQVNKQDSINFKTEKSSFDSTHFPLSTDKITPSPTTGAFAKILDEARQESTKSKNTPSKSDSENESVSKTKDDDSKTEKNRQTDENKEVDDNENQSKNNNESEENDDNTSPFMGTNIVLDTKNQATPNAPAARAILHIADLERIVSFVRTEVTNTDKQVLIALKHSVLEGLQIRISLNESGNLKAEFIAKNEEIRKQIKKRERELLDILKQRNSKFSTLDILLS